MSEQQKSDFCFGKPCKHDGSSLCAVYSEQQEMEKERERITEEIAFGRTPEGWEKDVNRLGYKKGKLFIADLEVYQQVVDHTCAICGDGPDPDIRTLRISAFYELKEVSDKFALDEKEGFYYLRFCKPCRGHFLFDILAPWTKSKGHKEHPNWNGEAPIQFV